MSYQVAWFTSSAITHRWQEKSGRAFCEKSILRWYGRSKIFRLQETIAARMCRLRIWGLWWLAFWKQTRFRFCDHKSKGSSGRSRLSAEKQFFEMSCKLWKTLKIIILLHTKSKAVNMLQAIEMLSSALTTVNIEAIVNCCRKAGNVNVGHKINAAASANPVQMRSLKATPRTKLLGWTSTTTQKFLKNRRVKRWCKI